MIKGLGYCKKCHQSCPYLKLCRPEMAEPGKEFEQPEEIRTKQMKICGLASETKADGRFDNFEGGIVSGMTFSWRDLITDERKELWMTFEEWIQFSKEITEAVARFKMEG